jgi:hypothetical protein
MPLAFGSLIGGLITLVGTSPNVIVARVRQEIVGQPFEMFDYAPVGPAIAATGLVCLTLTFWLLPKDRRGGASLDAAINIENYVAELRVRRNPLWSGSGPGTWRPWRKGRHAHHRGPRTLPPLQADRGPEAAGRRRAPPRGGSRRRSSGSWPAAASPSSARARMQPPPKATATPSGSSRAW